MFECQFDANLNFELILNAEVPSIIRSGSHDDRNITLISWDKYLEQNQTEPWQIFDTVACRGIEDSK